MARKNSDKINVKSELDSKYIDKLSSRQIYELLLAMGCKVLEENEEHKMKLRYSYRRYKGYLIINAKDKEKLNAGEISTLILKDYSIVAVKRSKEMNAETKQMFKDYILCMSKFFGDEYKKDCTKYLSSIIKNNKSKKDNTENNLEENVK